MLYWCSAFVESCEIILLQMVHEKEKKGKRERWKGKERRKKRLKTREKEKSKGREPEKKKGAQFLFEY